MAEENRESRVPVPLAGESRQSRVPLPLEGVLGRMKLPEGGPSVEETLSRVNVQPRVLQEFRPLSESLEWDLSDLQWAAAGLLPFVENEVPYTINNNSRLSENAAEVLFASCLETPPGEKIRLLELGAGTGLFARYLLDVFRARCRQEGKDFYDRLTFYVSDRSPATVRQWQERGVFTEHAGPAILGTCDGLRPYEFQNAEGGPVQLGGVRAVFCNYLLDAMPATVVRRGPQGCEEICVRTHLTEDSTRLKKYSRLTIEEIRALAAAKDPAARARLIPLMTLFEFETAFQPNGNPPPYAEEALALGIGLERVVLNHRALECLDACDALLEPGGFLLVNDYGPVQPDQIPALAASQHFGATMAMGVNFPLLQHHFAALGRTVVKPDEDDDRSVHARLILHTRLPVTSEAFQKQFGPVAHRQAEGPQEEARQHLEAGRLEQAMQSYQTAVARCPRDWRLLGEVSEFLIRRVGDYAAGLELARGAVRLNPWYSAWLWNVLGDSLFALERYEEAHEAYLQAQRIDPKDVRTMLNLAYCYAEFGAYREALEAIATGLAMDGAAVYRERLLEKQQQVLGAVAGKWTSEQEWMARRSARMSVGAQRPKQ